MDIYSSEEYIGNVMRIEQCSREDALKLIETFRRIDNACSLTASERVKAYRKDWRKRGMCQCCGKSDERTQSGYSTCKRCDDYRKAYYQKHKAELREKRRINRSGTGRQDH